MVFTTSKFENFPHDSDDFIKYAPFLTLKKNLKKMYKFIFWLWSNRSLAFENIRWISHMFRYICDLEFV